MKPITRLGIIAGASVVVLTGAADLWAQDIPPPTGKKIDYSPYPAKDFPNRVYFGDTHLHTSYSTDAGMIGNTLGPEEAYRFARGEEVKSSTGLPAKLQRPLDFLVVADHSRVRRIRRVQMSVPEVNAVRKVFCRVWRVIDFLACRRWNILRP